MTDEQIVALLASLGIDADKSKYGFPELQVHTTVPGIRQIIERAAQLAAPVAPEDAKDAARYRWIKEQAKRDGRDGGWWGYYVLPMMPGWDDTPYAADRGEGYHHKTLDDAIDAAMKRA